MDVMRMVQDNELRVDLLNDKYVCSTQQLKSR